MPDLGLIGTALAESVANVELPPKSAAVLVLAESYAAAIDAYDGDPEILKEIGPKLLAALTALGLTAAAPTQKGDAVAPAVSRLDELRQRRAARSGKPDAPAVDAASS